MKIRLLVLGLACAAGLSGQGKGPRSLYGHEPHSWQEDCFKNQALPYCQGRDFAIKPTPAAKGAAPASGATNQDPVAASPETVTPSVIVVGGIDWRFADPLADALAGFNFGKFLASPLARTLIAQFGANQGLAETDTQKIFARLSGVNQVALSVRDKQIVLMVTGCGSDSTLPTLEPGWKAVPVTGGAMLIGNAEAVDQAVQRIAAQNPLSDLARSAAQRQAGSDFWAVGSPKLLDPQTASAGMKRFSMSASTGDRFATDTAFEFDGVPDADKLRTWLASLGGATIEGNTVHVRVLLETGEVQRKFPQIAASPLGQRLGDLVGAARYLPARDATGRAKPVIYGLDSGPKEVNQ